MGWDGAGNAGTTPGVRYCGLLVRDADVVSKSFPGFWEQYDHLVM